MTGLSSTLVALALNVVGFQHQGGLLLQQPELAPNPNDASSWVLVDDDAGTCKRIHSSWARRAREADGISLMDYYGDRVMFLGWQGQMFSRTLEGSMWTPAGSGAWLNGCYPAVGDSHDVACNVSWDKGAWKGEDLAFLQDPRPEHAGQWFQLGPANACHVFAEGSRTRGPAGIVTVNLESGVAGLAGWTLSTGFASMGSIETLGNWLD